MHTHAPNYNEAIAEFCMMDDEFMTKIFEDNIPCTELLLQKTMQDDTIKVIETTTQKHFKNLQGHDVRLDIVAKKHDGTLFNVEVQNRNEGASAQRARYHASMLDANNLPKSEDYKALPDTCVIFITRNDVLKKNLPIYHIQRTILEAGEIFADGSQIIYVNNKIKDNTPLGRLMHDFSCKHPEDMYYDVLAQRATYFKKTQKGREEMSEVMERFAKKYAQAYAEEYAQEYANQVKYQQQIEFARKCLYKGYTVADVADLTELPIEEVRKLAEKRSA